MRTFLAIELPRSIQAQVQLLQHQLQGHLRAAQTDDCILWTPTEKIHLTLRFLGETNAAQQALITQGLHELAPQHAPFLLTPTDLGCFPHWREPNIVWLAVQGDLRALRRLQAQTEQLAQQAGFAAEQRAFAPHITLGRARRNADRTRLRQTGNMLKQFQRENVGEMAAGWVQITPFAVEKITYLQSELSTAGARYTPLAHGTLTNAE